MKARKLFILSVVLVACIALCGGCNPVKSAVDNVSGFVNLSDTATVIAKVAQIRSSYAVVAADLLEVKRGERLDVLEETDFERVHWYRVRAHDEAKTEGWIEAQNIITSKILDKSKQLAEADKDMPAQATGQLRAASNLRLSPEQKDDNLLFKLENGATFEITNWTYVPKPQDETDTDDAYNADQKKSKGKTKNAEAEAAKAAEEPDKLDEKYDVWYKVRLD
ncbi:MAG: SH3 domain-containing protein, partial [Acidobacteriota bacterium]|nr:SH3 domain-containing protein [Acidobacteriota bacterium]